MTQNRKPSPTVLRWALAFVVAVPWQVAAQVSPPPVEQSAPQLAASPKALFEFDPTSVKFSLNSLMRTLRDGRHEGWVLAAYPDPKTSRPLIGAGFSLDVEESDHPQNDPLNPHAFIEPSSAQLWQVAGLDPARLQRILEQFDRNLSKWNKKTYRKKIKANKLPPDVTAAEAMDLLRVSALQSIHNARAYCRNFDRLTAAQQMALSQLVYQMGVNLEEFTQFLALLNNESPVIEDVSPSNLNSLNQTEHWKAIQLSLIQSQWARRYSTRAISVISMFDPNYAENPNAAEKQVRAVLRPPKKRHRKNPNVASGSLLLPAQEPRINSESFENQLRNIVLTSPDLLLDRAPLDYSKGLFWNFKLLCFVAEGEKGVPAPTNYLQHSSESDSRQGLQAMSSIFPAQLCGRNKGSVILIPRSEGWLVSRFREPCSELSCLSPCTT